MATFTRQNFNRNYDVYNDLKANNPFYTDEAWSRSSSMGTQSAYAQSLMDLNKEYKYDYVADKANLRWSPNYDEDMFNIVSYYTASKIGASDKAKVEGEEGDLTFDEFLDKIGETNANNHIMWQESSLARMWNSMSGAERFWTGVGTTAASFGSGFLHAGVDLVTAPLDLISAYFKTVKNSATGVNKTLEDAWDDFGENITSSLLNDDEWYSHLITGVEPISIALRGLGYATNNEALKDASIQGGLNLLDKEVIGRYAQCENWVGQTANGIAQSLGQIAGDALLAFATAGIGGVVAGAVGGATEAGALSATARTAIQNASTAVTTASMGSTIFKNDIKEAVERFGDGDPEQLRVNVWHMLTVEAMKAAVESIIEQAQFKGIEGGFKALKSAAGTASGVQIFLSRSQSALSEGLEEVLQNFSNNTFNDLAYSFSSDYDSPDFKERFTEDLQAFGTAVFCSLLSMDFKTMCDLKLGLDPDTGFYYKNGEAKSVTWNPKTFFEYQLASSANAEAILDAVDKLNKRVEALTAEEASGEVDFSSELDEIRYAIDDYLKLSLTVAKLPEGMMDNVQKFMDELSKAGRDSVMSDYLEKVKLYNLSPDYNPDLDPDISDKFSYKISDEELSNYKKLYALYMLAETSKINFSVKTSNGLAPNPEIFARSEKKEKVPNWIRRLVGANLRGKVTGVSSEDEEKKLRAQAEKVSKQFVVNGEETDEGIDIEDSYIVGETDADPKETVLTTIEDNELAKDIKDEVDKSSDGELKTVVLVEEGSETAVTGDTAYVAKSHLERVGKDSIVREILEQIYSDNAYEALKKDVAVVANIARSYGDFSEEDSDGYVLDKIISNPADYEKYLYSNNPSFFKIISYILKSQSKSSNNVKSAKMRDAIRSSSSVWAKQVADFFVATGFDHSYFTNGLRIEVDGKSIVQYINDGRIEKGLTVLLGLRKEIRADSAAAKALFRLIAYNSSANTNESSVAKQFGLVREIKGVKYLNNDKAAIALEKYGIDVVDNLTKEKMFPTEEVAMIASNFDLTIIPKTDETSSKMSLTSDGKVFVSSDHTKTIGNKIHAIGYVMDNEEYYPVRYLIYDNTGALEESYPIYSPALSKSAFMLSNSISKMSELISDDPAVKEALKAIMSCISKDAQSKTGFTEYATITDIINNESVWSGAALKRCAQYNALITGDNGAYKKAPKLARYKYLSFLVYKASAKSNTAHPILLTTTPSGFKLITTEEFPVDKGNLTTALRTNLLSGTTIKTKLGTFLKAQNPILSKLNLEISFSGKGKTEILGTTIHIHYPELLKRNANGLSSEDLISFAIAHECNHFLEQTVLYGVGKGHSSEKIKELVLSNDPTGRTFIHWFFAHSSNATLDSVARQYARVRNSDPKKSKKITLAEAKKFIEAATGNNIYSLEFFKGNEDEFTKVANNIKDLVKVCSSEIYNSISGEDILKQFNPFASKRFNGFYSLSNGIMAQDGSVWYFNKSANTDEARNTIHKRAASFVMSWASEQGYPVHAMKPSGTSRDRVIEYLKAVMNNEEVDSIDETAVANAKAKTFVLWYGSSNGTFDDTPSTTLENAINNSIPEGATSVDGVVIKLVHTNVNGDVVAEEDITLHQKANPSDARRQMSEGAIWFEHTVANSFTKKDETKVEVENTMSFSDDVPSDEDYYRRLSEPIADGEDLASDEDTFKAMIASLTASGGDLASSLLAANKASVKERQDKAKDEAKAKREKAKQEKEAEKAYKKSVNYQIDKIKASEDVMNEYSSDPLGSIVTKQNRFIEKILELRKANLEFLTISDIMEQVKNKLGSSFSTNILSIEELLDAVIAVDYDSGAGIYSIFSKFNLKKVKLPNNHYLKIESPSDIVKKIYNRADAVNILINLFESVGLYSKNNQNANLFKSQAEVDSIRAKEKNISDTIASISQDRLRDWDLFQKLTNLIAQRTQAFGEASDKLTLEQSELIRSDLAKYFLSKEPTLEGLVEKMNKVKGISSDDVKKAFVLTRRSTNFGSRTQRHIYSLINKAFNSKIISERFESESQKEMALNEITELIHSSNYSVEKYSNIVNKYVKDKQDREKFRIFFFDTIKETVKTTLEGSESYRNLPYTKKQFTEKLYKVIVDKLNIQLSTTLLDSLVKQVEETNLFDFSYEKAVEIVRHYTSKYNITDDKITIAIDSVDPNIGIKKSLVNKIIGENVNDEIEYTSTGFGAIRSKNLILSVKGIASTEDVNSVIKEYNDSHDEKLITTAELNERLKTQGLSTREMGFYDWVMRARENGEDIRRTNTELKKEFVYKFYKLDGVTYTVVDVVARTNENITYILRSRAQQDHKDVVTQQLSTEAERERIQQNLTRHGIKVDISKVQSKSMLKFFDKISFEEIWNNLTDELKAVIINSNQSDLNANLRAYCGQVFLGSKAKSASEELAKANLEDPSKADSLIADFNNSQNAFEFNLICETIYGKEYTSHITYGEYLLLADTDTFMTYGYLYALAKICYDDNFFASDSKLQRLLGNIVAGTKRGTWKSNLDTFNKLITEGNILEASYLNFDNEQKQVSNELKNILATALGTSNNDEIIGSVSDMSTLEMLSNVIKARLSSREAGYGGKPFAVELQPTLYGTMLINSFRQTSSSLFDVVNESLNTLLKINRTVWNNTDRDSQQTKSDNLSEISAEALANTVVARREEAYKKVEKLGSKFVPVGGISGMLDVVSADNEMYSQKTLDVTPSLQDKANAIKLLQKSLLKLKDDTALTEDIIRMFSTLRTLYLSLTDNGTFIERYSDIILQAETFVVEQARKMKTFGELKKAFPAGLTESSVITEDGRISKIKIPSVKSIYTENIVKNMLSDGSYDTVVTAIPETSYSKMSSKQEDIRKKLKSKIDAYRSMTKNNANLTHRAIEELKNPDLPKVKIDANTKVDIFDNGTINKVLIDNLYEKINSIRTSREASAFEKNLENVFGYLDKVMARVHELSNTVNAESELARQTAEIKEERKGYKQTIDNLQKELDMSKEVYEATIKSLEEDEDVLSSGLKISEDGTYETVKTPEVFLKIARAMKVATIARFEEDRSHRMRRHNIEGESVGSKYSKVPYDSLFGICKDYFNSITSEDIPDLVDFFEQVDNIVFSNNPEFNDFVRHIAHATANYILKAYTEPAETALFSLVYDEEYYKRLYAYRERFGSYAGSEMYITQAKEWRRQAMEDLFDTLDMWGDAEIREKLENILNIADRDEIQTKDTISDNGEVITNDIDSINEMLNDLVKTVREKYKSDKGKATADEILGKILKFQRAAMLSGIGTRVRTKTTNVAIKAINTVSNEMTKGIAKRKIASLEEQGIEQIDINVKADSDAKNFVKEQRVDAIVTLFGSGLNRYDPSTAEIVRENKTSLKSGEDIQRILQATLEAHLKDEVIFRNDALNAAYKWVLSGVADDNFIKAETKRVFAKMLTQKTAKMGIAEKEEFYRAFTLEHVGMLVEAFRFSAYEYMHRDNFIFKMEKEIKSRFGDKAYFALKTIFPFAPSSWNFFIEALRFTPAGLAKSIYNLTTVENDLKRRATMERLYQKVYNGKSFRALDTQSEASNIVTDENGESRVADYAGSISEEELAVILGVATEAQESVVSEDIKEFARKFKYKGSDKEEVAIRRLKRLNAKLKSTTESFQRISEEELELLKELKDNPNDQTLLKAREKLEAQKRLEKDAMSVIPHQRTELIRELIPSVKFFLESELHKQQAPSKFYTAIAAQNVGKGIFGSAFLLPLGLLFALSGVAKWDDEKRSMVIMLGDTLSVDFSDVYGLGSSLILGMLLGQALTTKDKSFNNLIKIAKTALTATFDNNTFADFFNEFKYYDSVGDWMMSMPATVVGGYMPNLIKTTAGAFRVYNVDYSNNDFVAYFQKFAIKNFGVGGMPFVDAKVDPYTGRKQTRYGTSNVGSALAANVFNAVSDINVGVYDVSSAERVSTSYGVHKGQLSGSYTLSDGTKLQMPSSQRYDLNELYGKLNSEALNKLYSNKTVVRLKLDNGKYGELRFSQMTNAQKATAIEKIMNANAKIAKVKILTDSGTRYYGSASELETLRKAGIRQNLFRQTSELEGFVE